MGLALIVTFPALALRISRQHPDPIAAAIIFGVAIVGAAFILSWAAEAIQVDISQGLAIALLALITVLPEYSVDLYFAWEAGKRPEYAAYAAANMTGANRLLIGFGWSVVVLLFWLKSRRPALELEAKHSMELAVLGVAALYGLSIFVKGSIHWIDSIVLIGLFGYYLWGHSRGSVEEPELMGPSASLASLPAKSRRTLVGLLAAFSAAVILASAEPFANGLVETGKGLGIDEFILVQWIAPLASEAPEIIIASLFALRNAPTVGISAIISATVNQWTLLIGCIPLVYSASLGALSGLPLDERQSFEVFLTAAQAIAAVVLVSRLLVSVQTASLLFVLFFTQLWFPGHQVRLGFSILYLAIAFLLLAFSKERRTGAGGLISSLFSRNRH